MIAINNEFPGQRPFTSLNFLDHPSGLDVLQACNGLFCCCSIESNETKRKYYIYNPTNKQFTTLSQFHGRAIRPVLGINLAFDPSKSQHCKVVCVRSCESPHGLIKYPREMGHLTKSLINCFMLSLISVMLSWSIGNCLLSLFIIS